MDTLVEHGGNCKLFQFFLGWIRRGPGCCDAKWGKVFWFTSRTVGKAAAGWEGQWPGPNPAFFPNTSAPAPCVLVHRQNVCCAPSCLTQDKRAAPWIPAWLNLAPSLTLWDQSCPGRMLILRPAGFLSPFRDLQPLESWQGVPAAPVTPGCQALSLFYLRGQRNLLCFILKKIWLQMMVMIKCSSLIIFNYLVRDFIWADDTAPTSASHRCSGS